MSVQSLRRSLVMATVVTMAVITVGCGKAEKEVDPAVEVRNRLRDRLEESFSRDQARCIVDKLRQPAVVELTSGEPLGAGDTTFKAYSVAVRACVVGETSTTSTTPSSSPEKPKETPPRSGP